MMVAISLGVFISTKRRRRTSLRIRGSSEKALPAKRHNLTREQTIQLNSFKSRLSIFANKEIYEEFYDLIIFITEETDNSKITSRMDAFTEMLLQDLKHPSQSSKGKKQKKSCGA